MGKNNWVALEAGTVSKMNQPFFIASGVYNPNIGVVVPQLELQVTPGTIRFPNQAGVCANYAAQQVAIQNPQASQYLTLFIRSNNSIIVSGSALAFPTPGAPRYDAEPIGTVYTGNPINTTNLSGPWNMNRSEEHTS